MLHIFVYIYEKQYDRKIQKNLNCEYMFTGGKCVRVYVSYLFRLLMTRADEHVSHELAADQLLIWYLWRNKLLQNCKGWEHAHR